MFLLCFCHACVCRYSLGVTQEEMKQELHDYLPSLEHWAKEYLNSQTPKAISLKMYVCIHTHTHKCYQQCRNKPNDAQCKVNHSLKSDSRHLKTKKKVQVLCLLIYFKMAALT